MEIIKLNIIPSGVNPTCHASQYDEGRVIRVELYEGLTPFTLQASDEIGLSIRKPDDKIVTMVVENTEDNYVDIVTTKQACAIVGANLCELTIKRSSVNIGTLNFYMQVERDPLADGDDSESEIRDLQERVNACVEIALADLYDGTSVLFDSEPVLDHAAPYTVSSDGIARAFGVVNTALAGKVDNSALTTNYYNKTQVDGALSNKVDISALEYYYTKNDTYSKNEVNNLLAAMGIDDLDDVEIDEQTLAAGQGIVYDALTGKWTNGEVSSTSTLEELTDTDINNKQDGDGILFNSTSNKWINQAITKELSKAAYDNLSQAEKENGTAYYVPDDTSAPITAENIEYSTGVNVKQAIDSKADASSLAAVATSGSFNDLSNIPILIKGAYKTNDSKTVFEIPYTSLVSASGREYGIALVAAWKELYALFWNADTSIFITPLTSGSNRQVTCEWLSNTRVIKLTFSASIYYGIGVYTL